MVMGLNDKLPDDKILMQNDKFHYGKKGHW